jgi:putative PIN family toxin of toxin-antitoxin system
MSYRVIIDTNLWISFLISKDYSKLDEILFTKKATLVFSQELLDEFITVVRRPKFRRFFSPSDIEDVIETIEEYADFVEVNSNENACRDIKDNFLLSLSIDGNVDFLLTGDKDLLTLNPYKSTTIITLSEFLQTL